MKIAFDQQIFNLQEYGGVSRYVYELSKEMAVNYGQDISIIAPLYINKYLRLTPDIINVYGIPIHQVPKTGKIVRATNSLLVRPILKILSPDIVHETYYTRSRISPKKSKIILTVHDMIHERYPDSFSAKDPTRKQKITAIARADHIICVSRHTQQDLIEILGTDPEKTTVVHHGLSLENYLQEEYQTTRKKPYILFVGRRSGYKNFAGLLRAVASSSILRGEFHIVCFGGGKFTPLENALIAELGFSDETVIQLSGSDCELVDLYKNASVFVYPSFCEGFGFPPLEAMRFDCPVACSGVSSIPEVVGDAGAYFEPGDVDDMRTKIENLVTDESLRSKLINAGRERIKVFTWKRCARETLDVYRKIVGVER